MNHRMNVTLVMMRTLIETCESLKRDAAVTVKKTFRAKDFKNSLPARDTLSTSSTLPGAALPLAAPTEKGRYRCVRWARRFDGTHVSYRQYQSVCFD